MSRKDRKRLISLSWRYLVLALAVTSLLTCAMITYGWMHYSRTLQTATKIQILDLSIVGPKTGALAMNVGEISAAPSGTKLYVFGIKSTVGYYWLQLAHTTNLPFTYTIYEATKTTEGQGDIQEEGIWFSKSNRLTPNSTKKDNTKSYGEYVHYQEAANPQYDYYPDLTHENLEDDTMTKFYILEISWNTPLTNKETDMIYLTVGTNGSTGAVGTGGNA